MKRAHRFTMASLAAVFAVGIAFAPLSARASEEGERNTAIGLGAAAVGLLVTQKNKLPGIVAAGAAAYAYKRYDDSIRDRHRREDRYFGRDRWNDNYRDRDRWGDNNYDDFRRRQDYRRLRDRDDNRIRYYRDRDNSRNRRDWDKRNRRDRCD